MTRIRSFFATTRSAASDMLLLALAFSLPYLLRLGTIPLLDPDEGRYAEIPREMLESGDFITPFLNYVKYFEKPPLHYWLTAMSFRIFGESEFAARLPGALCGFLSVLLIYHVGRRVFDRRVGIISAAILGLSPGYMAQARICLTDTTLTFCMAACLGFFLIASREEEKRKGLYYHLFYLFSALAVLAKGLIGFVLPGGIIFFYMLFGKRWRLLREMRLLTGIPLFLAVAAPWFVAVSFRNPGFAQFFFIHEHFERFLTKVHGRYQPPWYFVPVLLGCMLPWSFFIPAGFTRFWRERNREGRDGYLFLVIWAVFIFAFFSKSDSKLPPYILPVFPALALLIGESFTSAFDRHEQFRPLKVQAWVISGFLFLVGIGGILYPHLASKPQISPVGGATIGLLFAAGGVAAAVATFRKSSLQLFLALALFCYLLEIVAPPFILGPIAAKKSPKELAVVAARNATDGTIIATYGLRQGVSFYAKRRVVLVGDPNELTFGSGQGDQSAWFLDHQRFLNLWEGNRHVIVLLSPEDADSLRSRSSIPVRELGRQEKKVLLSNR